MLYSWKNKFRYFGFGCPDAPPDPTRKFRGSGRFFFSVRVRSDFGLALNRSVGCWVEFSTRMRTLQDTLPVTKKSRSAGLASAAMRIVNVCRAIAFLQLQENTYENESHGIINEQRTNQSLHMNPKRKNLTKKSVFCCREEKRWKKRQKQQKQPK